MGLSTARYRRLSAPTPDEDHFVGHSGGRGEHVRRGVAENQQVADYQPVLAAAVATEHERVAVELETVDLDDQRRATVVEVHDPGPDRRVRRDRIVPPGELPGEQPFRFGRRRNRRGPQLPQEIPVPPAAGVLLTQQSDALGADRPCQMLVDQVVRICRIEHRQAVDQRLLRPDGWEIPAVGDVDRVQSAPVQPQASRRVTSQVGWHGRLEHVGDGPHLPQPRGRAVAEHRSRLPGEHRGAPGQRRRLVDAVHRRQQSMVGAGAAAVVDRRTGDSLVEQLLAGADPEVVHVVEDVRRRCRVPRLPASSG